MDKITELMSLLPLSSAAELQVPAHVHLRGMANALSALVSVGITPGSVGTMCSGWLLTPTLMLVPGFALRDFRRKGLSVRIAAFDGVEVAWEHIVNLDQNTEFMGQHGSRKHPDTEWELAVVALAKPVSLSYLRLRTESLTTRDRVLLLSLAGGREPMYSDGTVLSVAEQSIYYDATTGPGASGGLVFDHHWRIAGIHIGAQRKDIGERAHVGFGIGVAGLLQTLQQSRHWSEIASYYRLADMAAAQAVLDRADAEVIGPASSDLRLRMALRADFDPALLSAADRAALETDIIDTAAPRWTLQSAARRDAIRSAGNLAVLRSLSGDSRSDAPLQRMMDRVLAGPPYPLDEITDEELPWWLQGVDWFSDIAPGLPTPMAIERRLQQRRARSRLVAIAGRDFLGRDDALRKMHEWFEGHESCPLYVWGIGGVGKSALVAHFAGQLLASTPLIWLDFDRADLAPDDGVSVVAAIVDQARFQFDEFTVPGITGDNWWSAAAQLGAELQARNSGQRLLLVLDSFEVAQHSERFQELWPLLEILDAAVAGLRIVASGRVPLHSLQLNGKVAVGLELQGLSPEHAAQWLHGRGIRNPSVVTAVVQQSRGLPLILHLAARLIADGGNVADLPRDLPPAIVTGFLYRRILDRIRDEALKPLAQAMLVLRRVTAELLQPVLGDFVDLGSRTPAEWMAGLAREVALVEGGAVLHLRPEIRSPTLHWLQHHDSEKVRRIDERACCWYGAVAAPSAESAAELVYHSLRLDDIDAASRAWRDGCGAYLQYADEDLAPAAAAWLRERLGHSEILSTSLDVWELDAAERIRAARSRGLDRLVGGILAERKERSPGSVLHFHDAYELRSTGKVEAALALLDDAKRHGAAMDVLRQNALLESLLLCEKGSRQASDRLLIPYAGAEPEDGFLYHLSTPIERLVQAAIFAARIFRNVDLIAESEIARAIERRDAAVVDLSCVRWLSEIDVIDLRLQELLTAPYFEGALRAAQFFVRGEGFYQADFLEGLDGVRNLTEAAEPLALRNLRRSIVEGTSYGAADDLRDSSSQLVAMLEKAWRRWLIVSQGSLLRAFFELGADEPSYDLSQPILSALALVVSTPGLAITFLQHGVARLANQAVLLSIQQYYPEFRYDERVRACIETLKEDKTSARLIADSVRGVLLDVFVRSEDPLLAVVDRIAGRARSATRPHP